ncbi:RidA family protein [Rhodovulum visakhapatnamense]|uniref:Enamine deaminase RidA (YjgF/YER057c/UK114 family) n=1 Tax=Rhodovulum visakhapatnamense TaxID=364297 RepID=A0A4R8G9K9_9RHOB|nr:RidA family protein [Rhodovulum visakhapatnamense]TDX33869.1 enamine deaminase RidA (YjgF/YER057c/UK114 family) [Rhodovulum visakhapatnamense]
MTACPVEARLRELGHSLPDSAPSRAMFLPGKLSGNLLFLSGQICEWEGVPRYFGPADDSLDLAEAQAAARICALNLLFSIRAVVGSLGRVREVVRVGGFVSARPGFEAGPMVVNGASQLFIDLWGTAGQHARTAVCVASLPANALVEIDAVVEIA